MALATPSRAALEFVAQAAQAYATLISSPCADRESGLGGKLFYAGECDEAGRRLLVAANIAGAATLAATGDRGAQKLALRDGVVDFIVNSLDEALRILKNQLRKRETVAVCVGLDPGMVEREMNGRGVAPDLIRSDVPLDALNEALTIREAGEMEPDGGEMPALVTWRAQSGSPQEVAKLDEIALQCLDADEWAARRWLRLSPRFLGRIAEGLRVLSERRDFAARFLQRLRVCADRGEIGFAYEVSWYVRGEQWKYRFEPSHS